MENIDQTFSLYKQMLQLMVLDKLTSILLKIASVYKCNFQLNLNLANKFASSEPV